MSSFKVSIFNVEVIVLFFNRYIRNDFSLGQSFLKVLFYFCAVYFLLMIRFKNILEKVLF